jgi:hypothetical protein
MEYCNAFKIDNSIETSVAGNALTAIIIVGILEVWNFRI